MSACGTYAETLHAPALKDLVEDYLTLVRVSALERTSQDVGDVMQACVAEWQRLATAQGVLLRLDGIHDLGRAVVHKNTFCRALLNLVQNALDATPQGGTLTVRGRRTATHVQMQVQDTGSGIPTEQLATIFEPLYTTKPAGTGLGLYIVRELITVHDGQVTVERVVGQGTTMTVTLPLAGDTTASTAVTRGHLHRRMVCTSALGLSTSRNGGTATASGGVPTGSLGAHRGISMS